MLVIHMEEPDAVLREIDFGLLVFFASLFIVVKGFQQTNLPAQAWAGLKDHIDLSTGSGVVLYSLLVIIGSNTVSNVPLVSQRALRQCLVAYLKARPCARAQVLILSPSIPLLSDPRAYWLLLSYISTIAGNLTLVGSVANLIVVERAKKYYVLSFWEYFRFGFGTTLVVAVLGIAIIKGMLVATGQ